MKFSIIIPSYNEGEDVRLSIESAIGQNYPNKEILIVDDSADKTPDVIREYADRGVKYIAGPKKGCCEARNLGMREASGDVIVLLNADVKLPLDFLGEIKKHYDAGADYVLLESRVFNTESIWARFVEMQHRYESRKIGDKAEWTEGFSARREAVRKVGLIPGDFPLRFCRDWMLGKKLSDAGYKKIIDLSIIVTHKAPDNFREYWRVRKARGRFSSLTQYFLLKKNRLFLFFKFLAKDLLFLLKFLTIFPALFKVGQISRYSEKPIKDFFIFYYVYFAQELARAVGEWEGVLQISNQLSNDPITNDL